MFEKLNDNIKPWIFVVLFTIVCSVTVAVATHCSAGKVDFTEATVTVPKIKIYIKGEIKNPGLYEIDANLRLVELIELAGGETSEADIDRLNLAAILTDGTTVIIPKKGSEEEIPQAIAQTDQKIYQVGYSPDQTSQTSSTASSDKITSGTININTATVAQLMRLPGVGEATANKIISYRQSSGGFKAIEEIMNVSGIGEKKFEAMKQFLAVN